MCVTEEGDKTYGSDSEEERECCRTAKHVLRESSEEAARASTTPGYRCVSATAEMSRGGR